MFDQKFLDFADSASADHFDFEKYSAFADFGSADFAIADFGSAGFAIADFGSAGSAIADFGSAGFAIADFGFAGHFDFANSMQDWSQLGYSPSVESEFAN